MNRIFSLLKVTCFVLVFFVVGLFVSSTQALASCGTTGCTASLADCNAYASQYSGAVTTKTTMYVMRFMCEDKNQQNCTSNGTKVVLTNGQTYAFAGDDALNMRSCGSSQADLTCEFRNSAGAVIGNRTINTATKRFAVSCNELATCPSSMPTTCGNSCNMGNITCRASDGSVKTYANCKSGNLGCSLNGCNGQMSYCTNGGFACKADSTCTGTVPPPPGNWGSCGCFGSGECYNKPNNEGPTHPQSECMTNPQGVCVWNPAECRTNTSNPTPTPQPRACGEACKTTADCRNPSTGGFPVECRNGTCQLPLTGQYACPEGKSSGSICSCSAQQLCGQPCGPIVGNKLCVAGSVCGFVTPSNACKVNGVDQTSKQYCLPVNPSGGYSKKRCDVEPAINYIAADSLVKPDGTQTNMTAADAVNACKSICGDKVVTGAEECDWGTDNGKPGSMCDATCKKALVCGDTCSAQSACNKHQVTLVCVPGTGRPYCGFDALIENGITIEQTDARFTKPGMWRTSVSTLFSGGNEVYNHEVGGTISFWTTAREVTLLQTKATNRGKFTVLIDGKAQATQIDQYNATTIYKQPLVLNLRGADSPEYVCQSNVCRLASNPNSTTCAPVVTPTPTPTALVCDLNVSWASNANPDAWKYGDMITFTVAPAPSSRIPTGGSIRYRGEVAAYRGTTKVQSVTLTPISTNASQFQPMKVSSANATYYFRFSYCVKTSAGVETCSNWGAWQVPS